MLKKIILAAVGILALLIVAALVAPLFISAETYKQPLIDKLRTATGRNITIDGELSVRLFPVGMVKAEKVTLSNPQGFPANSPFMTLNSLHVEMDILPLLSGTFNVRELTLKQPHINLHVTKAGRNNWTLFSEAQPAAGKNKNAARDASSVATVPPDLLLSEVEIEDGSVNYINEQTGGKWELKELDSELELEGIASPFTLAGSGIWNGRNVKIAASIDSLYSFAEKKRTQIRASLQSELLSMETDGMVDQGAYYTGKAAVKSSSLKQLLTWVDPSATPIATPTALKLDMSGDAQCSRAFCHFENMKLVLDTVQATGDLKIDHAAKPPSITAQLTTGMLDLNQFLPQRQATSGGGLLIGSALAAEGWSAKSFDLSWMKAVNASIGIKTDGVKLRDLAIGESLLRARLERGRFNSDISNAVLYGGAGSISLSIDTTPGIPMLESQITLTKVQLEPLLKSLDISDRFSGAATLQASLASRGNSERDIIAALAGKGQGSIAGGTLEGIDLVNMMRNVQGAFTPAAGRKTEFSDISGSFLISQGVLTNSDLLLKAPTLTVSGAGQVNLPLQTISYRLTPQVMRMSQDPAAGPQAGVSVPVLISGSLKNPTYAPDVSAVLKEAITDPEQFKEKLKNTRGSLKDQVKDPKETIKNLKGILKGL